MHRFGQSHLTSNKHKWNNCLFICVFIYFAIFLGELLLHCKNVWTLAFEMVSNFLITQKVGGLRIQ